MTFNINIETKNVIKIFTLAVIFAVGVSALIRMYDALILIATSSLFALALNPAVSFLAKYMPKEKRGPAVAIVMALAIFIFSFVIFSIMTPVAKEASSFAETIPKKLEDLRAKDSFIGSKIEQYNLHSSIDQAVDDAKSNIENYAKTAINRIGDLGNSLLTSLTGIVITILMLLNGPNLIKSFANKLYRDKELRLRHEAVASKMYAVVTGYVNGQLMLALSASMLGLGAMLLFRVPYPLPLAAIVFIFGLIPLIGNTIAAILVMLFIILLKDATTALMMVAFFFVYQQVENVTLQPLVHGKTTEMPTLIIFVSVILGVAIIGPIGGIFAIPVAGCMKVLINDYLENRGELPARKLPVNFATKIKQKLSSKAKA